MKVHGDLDRHESTPFTTTSYLTLGDGDFSYSLDLARYFTVLIYQEGQRIQIIATGVDTLQALTKKYKDAPFILENLRKQEQQLLSSSLSVSIRHGVNAIILENDVDTKQENHSNNNQRQQQQQQQYSSLFGISDHVMFHHPHLGIEDAALHSRFLCHLFHSVSNFWMKSNGGVFHLTLVKGQYERWKCQEAASRHGLCLLNKYIFAPPPVRDSIKNTNGSTYHYRRHQTGKSFESRRPTSESITYTFGRECDEGMYIATHLPWQSTRKEASVPSKSVISLIPCPRCDKAFREGRSLKSHLRDKHSDGVDNLKTVSDQEPIPCPFCSQEETGTPTRTFPTAQALEAHITAKHSGVHTYIVPDWSIAKKNTTADRQDNFIEDAIKLKKPASLALQGQNEGDNCDDITCPICDLPLYDRSLDEHFVDFVPNEDSLVFPCTFCSKSFREERAKLQHENICSKRTTTKDFLH
jgi:uncharacterized C2H2 Zn-finger protein